MDMGSVDVDEYPNEAGIIDVEEGYVGPIGHGMG